MTGRPKITIRVDPAVRNKLSAESKRTGAPQAEIVRRILKKHLK